MKGPMVFAALAALLLAAASTVVSAGHESFCPGSASSVHARCSLTAEVAEPCPVALDEVRARLESGANWMDPHNNGTYQLTHEAVSGSGYEVLEGQRRTGDGRYTDKFRLTFEPVGSGCSVHACSESQVFSILDYSTNYCNLHNLYCGSGDGCAPVKHNLKLTHEAMGSCRSHDKKACATVKPPATSAVGDEAAKRRTLQQEDKECALVTTPTAFDLEAYISKPWFVQQQMATQYLPASWNYCVQAKYEKRQARGLWGWSIQVRNYAEEADGTVHSTGDTLCADGASSSDSAKLQVAPCFLPKIPGFFTGPYWVLEYSEAEGYALISGGQPAEWTPSGCRTNSDRGTGVTSGAGLWIFTRAQARDEKLIEQVRGLASKQGFDVSVLEDVSQVGCPAAV